MLYTFFSNAILPWYESHKRDLPWRNTSNPYEIWLSEVILQQTRVAQGLPYYQRFIDTFPTVEKLAKAEEEEVLRLWQGLGYYSRARNLHRCAKYISENLRGFFPNSYEGLLQLPGIGPYTAAAIASFSFKVPEPVVDGNVYRVLARIFGIQDDIAGGAAYHRFRALSKSLMPEDSPDIYNQAIMEFGALHCTPKSPGCADCIFQGQCFAHEQGVQDKLPVKTKKTKVQTRYFNYFVIRTGEELLMKKRVGEGIWESLYDFHNIDSAQKLDMDGLLHNDELSDIFLRKGVLQQVSKVYKHLLSHRKIWATFYLYDMTKTDLPDELLKQKGLDLYSYHRISALPKPVLVDKYLQENIF